MCTVARPRIGPREFLLRRARQAVRWAHIRTTFTSWTCIPGLPTTSRAFATSSHDSVLRVVPTQRWVEQVDDGGSSIAHLLLHMTRHHDLAVTTAIRDHPPPVLRPPRRCSASTARHRRRASPSARTPRSPPPSASMHCCAYLDAVFAATRRGSTTSARWHSTRPRHQPSAGRQGRAQRRRGRLAAPHVVRQAGVVARAMAGGRPRPRPRRRGDLGAQPDGPQPVLAMPPPMGSTRSRWCHRQRDARLDDVRGQRIGAGVELGQLGRGRHAAAVRRQTRPEDVGHEEQLLLAADRARHRCRRCRRCVRHGPVRGGHRTPGPGGAGRDGTR